MSYAETTSVSTEKSRAEIERTLQKYGADQFIAQDMHHTEVRAFLLKYYGNEKDGVSLRAPMHTIPTKDRFGLVTVHGVDYQIVDIGLRMLTPRELYKAQGFPDSYIIDRKPDGTLLTKTAQVRMCGNSVCPPLAEALVTANYTTIQQFAQQGSR